MIYTVRIPYSFPKLKLIVFPGFDLSAMSTDVYEDAIADVVGPETMASEPYVVKVRLTLNYVHCLLTGSLSRICTCATSPQNS